MTGPRRGVVIAFWSTTMIIPPYPGQWWCDTSSVWESWLHGGSMIPWRWTTLQNQT
jgi:hypothetical protein